MKTLEEVKQEAVIERIAHYHGNLTMAAKSLKIGRATIYRYIKQYDIKRVSANV